MQVEGYDVDIVVQGFPGKTVCHGGLGWSTVVLIRGRGRVAMIDTGNFNVRALLIDGLEEARSDACRSHRSSDDPCALGPLRELDAVRRGPDRDRRPRARLGGEGTLGRTSVPGLYVREFQPWPTAHPAKDGEEVLPGITTHMAPGHTPGHLIYVLKGTERDVIFTGDAAKNRVELTAARPTRPTISPSAWHRSRRLDLVAAAPRQHSGARPRYPDDPE